jgi:uncharacterized protein (UPF0261 family)
MCNLFQAENVYSDIVMNVKIIDMNDENPYFNKLLKNYKGSIAENVNTTNQDNPELRVITLTAKDADTVLEYRTITYNITKEFDHDKFRIDSNTGDVFAKVQFDREELLNGKQTTQYKIRVQAKDGAPSANCNPPPGSECGPNIGK